MKKYILLALSVVLMSILSCSRKPNYGQPNVDFESIKKSQSLWWTYHNKNIVLSSNFIALDNSSNRISKALFLKSLATGDFIPLKLNSTDSTYYKLFQLDQSSDKSIPDVVKSIAEEASKNFRLEGSFFPKFELKDLNGVEYSNENTKGKIVVLKCWFIACAPCIEEFPKLNELVEKYKNRSDIVFISLAFDLKEKLEPFLLKNPFRYGVVPDQKQFIFYDLNVREYPTHFIIDKNGIIRKVVISADEMIDALENDVLLNADAKQK
ncbi:MAG: TlpA disulfide reductase family protein [Prolixibacteraceae bacterium]|nr:TlpA disulfide reductase family protein [Prolixibacteraceae bacterium]